MDLGAIGRRHRTGSTLRYAMWVVITLLVGMLAIHATTTKWSDSVALAVANLVTATAFGVTAWLLTAEKEQYPNAKLFGATAALWVIDSVKTSSLGPLPAVSWIIGPLVMAAGATVMLRYPSTHLHRGERDFLIGLAAWIVIGRTAWVLTVNPATLGDPPSVWWPTVFHDPRASGYVETVFDAGCIILAAVFIVMVVRRLRRAKGIDRRMLLPVAVAAIAAGAAVGTEMLGRITVRGQPIYDTVLMVEAIALSAIPFAFLASTIRRQLAAVRGADIVLRLGGHSSVESVRDGLREALADPDLEVLYWVPESATYVTSEGHDCPTPPATGPHQLAVPLHTADGSPLAVVMTSLTAERHRGAVDLAAAASGLALHNARLQAELRAELQQVQESRARIVQAGVTERRRLERDLHDGAQQRLLGLGPHIAAIAAVTTDPATAHALTDVRSELRTALSELRDLAKGIHPGMLTDGGLGPALEVLVERSPVPVTVEVTSGRVTPAAESTAYFVACEAMANTIKHAEATSAAIRIHHHDQHLEVEVTDDGIGGADFRRGTGLLGIRDRVVAIGGHLTITSEATTGTRLSATIPCA